MSLHSGGGHLATDGYLHARLLGQLSAGVTKQELKNLKQLIRSSAMAPNKAIDEAKDFFALWGVLERQNLIKPGEYGFLQDHFELLSRMDLAAIIQEHSKEIEEFRRTQNQKRAAMVAVVDEEDDPLLKDFVVVHLTVK